MTYIHPRVAQLKFARSEFQRGMEGVSEDDARTRLPPMNCLSWMIAHLAWQEYNFWVVRGQDIDPHPEFATVAGYNRPPTTPGLEEAWAMWRTTIELAEPFLLKQSSGSLTTTMTFKGRSSAETIGTMILRTTHHYFYHTGEAQAVRQLLGHTDLPQFIGSIPEDATYHPEG